MKSAFGKVFKDKDGEEYGLIRECMPPYPKDVSCSDVLAEDGCGNYFLLVEGKVVFWDHEANDHLELANSIDEFIAHCSAPDEVVLRPEQVTSVWIDPELAKKFDLKVKP